MRQGDLCTLFLLLLYVSNQYLAKKKCFILPPFLWSIYVDYVCIILLLFSSIVGLQIDQFKLVYWDIANKFIGSDHFVWVMFGDNFSNSIQRNKIDLKTDKCTALHQCTIMTMV